ncbi:MFS transporter [Inmirania thermothiophila]|uniref:Sugar phosphate permease n=1 Tax=Inmirania thermothiophila TaxID=1750597 RepID=A0A3N1Y9S7_9GAMM|nr:MFS transporter [Inmirania thermothiophila]ROR34372.1 sugar phosphate permease [Inmirania thermothiophila]
MAAEGTGRALAVLAGGAAAIFAALGVGRFALGMLLPGTGAGLGLGYAEMGLLGTANFVGYLAAVLAAGPVAERFGARRVVAASVVLVGASMLGVAAAPSFAAAALLYALTGFGSGAANVPVMALVSAWFAPRLRGRAAGLVVSANGIAIALAGQGVPVLAAAPGGWRTAWAALGLLCLACAALAGWLLRDDPARLGLEPVGGRQAVPAGGGRLPPGLVAHLGAVYFAFGATYVVYATFVVTTLIDDHGMAAERAGDFWSLVGLLSLASGPLFGGLSDRIGRRRGLALVFALQTVAYGLMALRPGTAGVLVSVVLYGVSAWAIPTIMAAAVGDLVGAARAGTVFGWITFVFALGQVAGPAGAGWLAERVGGFGPAYGAAAVLTAAGTALSLALRSRRPPAMMEETP